MVTHARLFGVKKLSQLEYAKGLKLQYLKDLKAKRVTASFESLAKEVDVAAINRFYFRGAYHHSFEVYQYILI
jgi:hypothetical protein